MKWMNYAAFSLDTELTKNIHRDPSQLLALIMNLKSGRELYHCYYDLEPRDTFKEYSGIMRPAFDQITLDLDSKDDGGAKAWEDTKLLASRLDAEDVPHRIYFSGNKGFHVSIHKSAFGITEGPKDILQANVKNILFNLKKEYPTLDTGIWNANRKFRAFRSLNSKSNLYKIIVEKLDSGAWPELTDIKARAKDQPETSGSFLLQPVQKNPWLSGLAIESEATHTKASHSTAGVKELPQGTMEGDDSYKFRNMTGKKCIESMLKQALPQFNRHDIGLRIIYDLRATGTPIEKTMETLSKWARAAFSSESDSSERVAGTLRMVTDAYSKPQDYKFGCYDPIRMAYCSAKCKIYSSLDSKKRAEPLDQTKAHKQENEVRRNANLELSEGQLADELIKEFGGQVCKINGEYFQWLDTHWERMDRERFEGKMGEYAVKTYNNKATSKKLLSLLTQIKLKIPVAPEVNHFYRASLNKFNFTDGTAVVTRDLNGKLQLKMTAHDPSDLLSHVAPFPLFGEDKLPRNGDFKHYLKTREEDVGEEGLRIIKQMLGAALVPYIPRIFFIVGKTNSGKSTLALLILKLLGGEKNVSHALPIKSGSGGADRFRWEDSIGKLANIALELDDKETLDVNTLKMVRDKSPISVDRKGLARVQATLPYLHIYCCNEMPPSLEGNTGALNNRVSMLFFKPGYLNGLGGVTELANHLWDFDAGGILDVAREGLKDLIESDFKYYESDSSKEMVKKWQKSTDQLELFVEDLKFGGIEYKAQVDGNGWHLGSAFYQAYVNWAGDAGVKGVFKRHSFYDRVLAKYGVEVRARGEGGVRLKLDAVLQGAAGVALETGVQEF